MNSSLVSSALAIVASLALAACSKAPAPVAPVQHQTYDVRGVLQSINFAEKTAMIEHEEIPDYMPAMTMPFDVRSIAEIAPFSAGDRLEFKLVVTDTASWIQNIKRIGAGAVQAAPDIAESGAPRLKEGDAMPEFRLTDDQGSEVTHTTFAGKPLLVTFIFTRCPIPNFCPLMSRNFSAIRGAITEDKVLAAQTRFLSISFDSEFDTPAILHTYAKNYTQEHDTWRFASGTTAEVNALTKAFSVHVQRDSGTFSHGLCTALIGPDGTIRKLWRGNNWETSEAVAALRELRNSMGRVAQEE